jgi:NADH-quinone oxidoreductase subunit C
MNEQQLHDKLRSTGIAGLADLDTSACDPFVVVEAGSIVEVLTFLRDDPETAMEMLHNLTAVQREASFEVVYHLCSYARHHSLTLKVIVQQPEGSAADWEPNVPSVAGVYNSADWHEREQWDLLGVRFAGHPDHRRILLPEEWIGHPLRKDYVYPTAFGEIPLELDAIPIYERDEANPPAPSEPRPAGTPLIQPPSEYSTRPDAGGRAPAKEKKDKS